MLKASHPHPPPVTHPLLGLSQGCLLVPAFMFSSLKFLHPSWIDYWLTYRHFLPISLRYTFLIYKFPKILDGASGMFGRNICRTFFSRGSFSIFQAHFAHVLGNLSNSILSP